METAARLKKCLLDRKVYRIGPDQFAFIIEEEKHLCVQEVEKGLTIFEKPFIIENEDYILSGAAGFTYVNAFNPNIADLISNTEFALAKAKRFPNSYIEYDSTLTRNTDKIRLVKDLKKAFVNQELEIYYQPQIDAITEKVCGAEALIRWNHPEKGIIPPFSFLEVAEEYDLLEEIDRLVVERTMNDIVEFSKMGINMPLSVNFSATTICSSRTIPFLINCLKNIPINPALLTVEITETSLMGDIEKSKTIIQQLSSMGINIAIDDFGTGYSSMGYLMRYPTTYLKIDREFITNINQIEALRIVTSNIIKLGHSLSMMVVAEGVETIEELNVLKNFGCDIIQGYFYSKPIPKNQFMKFIENNGFSSIKTTEI